MMQMMSAPTPDGREVPMLMMVAQVVKSNSLAVGWVYHLFNSAVIGGIFGWLLGTRRAGRLGAGAGWGAVYGLAWWVLGALILMLSSSACRRSPRSRWLPCGQSRWGA